MQRCNSALVKPPKRPYGGCQRPRIGRQIAGGAVVGSDWAETGKKFNLPPGLRASFAGRIFLRGRRCVVGQARLAKSSKAEPGRGAKSMCDRQQEHATITRSAVIWG
jgi:hypothetical protein